MKISTLLNNFSTSDLNDQELNIKVNIFNEAILDKDTIDILYKPKACITIESQDMHRNYLHEINTLKDLLMYISNDFKTLYEENKK